MNDATDSTTDVLVLGAPPPRPMVSSSARRGCYEPEPSPLWDRVREGDVAALSLAFDTYRDRLARSLELRFDRRLRGRVDADDVLQEAFLEAQQRLQHCRATDEPSLFLWLRMVALQTLCDVHRRHIGAQRRDASREMPLATPYSDASSRLCQILAGNITTPSQVVAKAEMQQALEKAVAELSETDREILWLRHFDELSNSEVAALLSIHAKAASVRYVRALARLKERLAFHPDLKDWLLQPPRAGR